MKQILINENYRINIVPRNYVLEAKTEVLDRTTKEYKTEWKTVGYYGTIENLCKHLIDCELSTDSKERVDLTDLLVHLNIFEQKLTLKIQEVIESGEVRE